MVSVHVRMRLAGVGVVSWSPTPNRNGLSLHHSQSCHHPNELWINLDKGECDLTIWEKRRGRTLILRGPEHSFSFDCREVCFHSHPQVFADVWFAWNGRGRAK